MLDNFFLECHEWIELRMRRCVEKLVKKGSWRHGIDPSTADQRVLRWLGHVERINEYRIARRLLMADVSGWRVQGKPRLGLMDGVKVAWAADG